MAEVKITGLDAVSKSLRKTLEMTIADIGSMTHEVVQNKHGKITPVKTGFTRDQWTLNYSKRDFEVANRVPWIGKLEAGASRQAPRGMIGPALSQVKRKLK